MKRLVLLGASGSIGTQTLDIISHRRDRFALTAFGVGRRIETVARILQLYPEVSTFSVAREEDAVSLRKQYPHRTILSGPQGMEELARRQDYDVLVNALVGFAGFRPTLAAIESGHDVALANKETLVCGGELIDQALKAHGRHLYPIDSEHSAIWQCLRGNEKKSVRRLLITCSGGPFRTLGAAQLENVTPTQALAHPRWTMGPKITIDSANLMNKGFEVMEAHWLFHLPYEQIDVVVHPESVIHSMVEFVDHSIMAQMAMPDMRLPIAYALGYPERMELPEVAGLDLIQTGSLHFEAPDPQRFPLLPLAVETGRRGGVLPAVLNAANEMANAAFRQGKIGFKDIERIVAEVVEAAPARPLTDVQGLEEADAWGRQEAMRRIKEGSHS